MAHTVIADNAGGHLMQHGQVDMVIVGTDRTTATGDVCNKIGTYLKALAAHDNGVPFYVAVPSPSIDWTVRNGVLEIPIENRPPREVTHLAGRLPDGSVATVAIDAGGQRRRQSRVRRDARAAGHRPRHRARRHGGVRGRPAKALSRPPGADTRLARPGQTLI